MYRHLSVFYTPHISAGYILLYNLSDLLFWIIMNIIVFNISCMVAVTCSNAAEVSFILSHWTDWSVVLALSFLIFPLVYMVFIWTPLLLPGVLLMESLRNILLLILSLGMLNQHFWWLHWFGFWSAWLLLCCSQTLPTFSQWMGTAVGQTERLFPVDEDMCRYSFHVSCICNHSIR